MFRKPKQRNLRGRTEADANDEDSATTQEHPPVIAKPVIKKPDAPKMLLSFGDDEGNPPYAGRTVLFKLG